MSCEQFPPNRSLEDLSPKYRLRFERYLEAANDMFPQFNIFPTETLRSDERQACLLASGASQVKHSNHQDGIAMDIAILRHSTDSLDWRPAVFRNVYRLLDPRKFGLTSGAHLWGWDQNHLQIVEDQGRGKNLSAQLESYDQNA